MVGGLALALAMNQQFRMKNLVRALLLLPFIVPTVLSTVAWMWMLDPAFSVVNWFLIALGVPKPGPSWLGNPALAMASIIVINTWRGLPFYGITLLAGLQTVPPELYEAATIDGASGWQRFRYVTLPLLQPIILIVTLFSVIFTFADFQLVYVLTHGGPQNATQLFATYAFDIAHGRRPARPRRLGRVGDAAGTGAADRRADPLHAEAVMVTGHGPARAGGAGVAAGRLFSGGGAVPVLLDGDHLDEAQCRALQPEHDAAARAQPDPEALCRPVDPDELSAVDLEHDAGRGRLDRDLARARGRCSPTRLARMRFAGAGLIAMTVAAIYLVPQPLLFIPLADVINRLDLGNTLTAVILTYPTMLVPFCAWLLLGYFKTVPKELEEAARIDGASRLQTMRRIFLPLCTPGFISAGIFAFTLSQNEFLYALIFLTKSSVRTVPVGVIAELIRGDVFYWGQLMAGALLGSIPVAHHLLVLCRALRRRADLGLGQGVRLPLHDPTASSDRRDRRRHRRTDRRAVVAPGRVSRPISTSRRRPSPISAAASIWGRTRRAC